MVEWLRELIRQKGLIGALRQARGSVGSAVDAARNGGRVTHGADVAGKVVEYAVGYGGDYDLALPPSTRP